MAWTLVLDDSFSHADTTAGAAGSTTGVPTTPAVGAANGWKDEAGGVANIQGNQLRLVAVGANYNTQNLIRTDITGNPDQRMVVTVPTGGSQLYYHIGIKLRVVDDNNFYLLEVSATEGIWDIYAVSGGVLTTIDNGTFPVVTSNNFSVDFSVTGLSPSTISLIITNVDTSTIVLNQTITDSTSALQQSGLSFALTSWSSVVSSTFYSRVQAYTKTPPMGNARSFLTNTDRIDFGIPAWMALAQVLSGSIWVNLTSGWNTITSGFDRKLICGQAGDMTGGAQAWSLVWIPAEGLQLWLISPSSAQQVIVTTADPLPALAGTGWFNIAWNWVKDGTSFIWVNGVSQSLNRGAPIGSITSSTAHLTIGPPPGSTYWDGLQGWEVADFGLLMSPNPSNVNGVGVFNATDITNLVAGYPVEVVTLDRPDDHGLPFFQDACNFTGASPELSVNGTMNGTVTGTASVAGPALFPPVAAKAAPITQIVHSPGSATLTLSWLHGVAPATPVTFTPTVGAGTFSPATITLSTSGTTTGSSTLTVSSGLTGLPQTYQIAIANTVDIMPVSAPVQIALPVNSIASGYPVVDPTGEYVEVMIVDGGGNPVAPTAYTPNACTVTVNGGTPRHLDIWLIDNHHNWACAPILDQWHRFMWEQDSTVCTLAGTGWTQINGVYSWHYSSGYSVYNGGSGPSAMYSLTSTDTATYACSVPFAGSYQVYMIELDLYNGGLHANLDGTTASQFVFKDGSTTVGSPVVVNQTQRQNWDQNGWEDTWYKLIKLGAPITISSGTFQCVLSNTLTTGRLYAGALYLKYVPRAVQSTDTVVVNFPDGWLTTGGTTLGQTLNATATMESLATKFPYNPSAARMNLGMNLSAIASAYPCKPTADLCGLCDPWTIQSGSVSLGSNGGAIMSMTNGSSAYRTLVAPSSTSGILGGYPQYEASTTIPWTISGTLSPGDTIGVQLSLSDGGNFPGSPVSCTGTFSQTILVNSYPNTPYYTTSVYLIVKAIGNVNNQVHIHAYPPEVPAGWSHFSAPLIYNKITAYNSIRRATTRFMNNLGINHSACAIWTERAGKASDGYTSSVAWQPTSNLVSIGPVDTNSSTNADGAWTYFPPDGGFICLKVTHDGSYAFKSGQRLQFANLSDPGPWPMANVNDSTYLFDPTYPFISVCRNPTATTFLLFAAIPNPNNKPKPGNPGQMVTLAANHVVTGQVEFYSNCVPMIGQAFEDIIAMANETNSDLHLNIPHPADNNFITNLANLVVANLTVGLKCHIELSNEPWNWIFTQTYHFWFLYKQYSGDNSNILPMSGYGYRAHQVFQIFQPIWNADSRRNPLDCSLMLNCQIGMGSTTTWALEGMQAAGATPAMYAPPNSTLRIAVNGYHDFAPVNANLNAADWQTTIQSRFSAKGMISFGGGVLTLLQNDYAAYVQGNVSAATSMGYTVIPYVYEGGIAQVVINDSNYWPYNANDMAYQIFQDPLMYDFTLAFLEKMSGLGFDVFSYFTLCSNAFTAGTQKWMVYRHDLETDGTGALTRTAENPNPYSMTALSEVGGAVMQFASTGATASAPTVTSPTATSITTTAATLGGNVTSNGGASLTSRGVAYSQTSVNSNPIIGGTGVTTIYDPSNVVGVFTDPATGLTAATGYSYAPFAINSAGTTYAPVSTFTTLSAAIAPVVTSPTATAITVSAATLGGNVASNGGAALTERGIVYSQTSVNSNPIIGGAGVTKVDDAFNVVGVFTEPVSGLAAFTQYSYAPFAINSVGTTYGSVATFTTLSAATAPVVTSSAAALITTSSVTLSGNVVSDGGSPITARGFVFSLTGTNSNPIIGGIGVTNLVDGSVTTGTFTAHAGGLTSGAIYSFAAYCTNAIGTTYSSPTLSFMTLIAAPTPTPTSAASQGPSTTTTPTRQRIIRRRFLRKPTLDFMLPSQPKPPRTTRQPKPPQPPQPPPPPEVS